VLGVLFAILCFIWSTTWAAIRVCEQGFTPLWAATLRFVLAGAILSAWALARRSRDFAMLRRWELVLAGAVNALSYSLLYLAEQHISGGTAAVLAATNPFFVLGVAAALGYEKASLRKLAGMAVGFLGVVFLFRSGLRASGSTALAMTEVLFAASILWPTYTLLLRRVGDAGVTSRIATLGFIVWTALFLALGALLFEGRPHWPAATAPWTALLYLAVIGSALAWSLYNHLLRVLSLSVMSTLLFIEPAGALGVDWLLGEKAPGAAAWLGAAMVLAGVALVALAGKRPAPRRYCLRRCGQNIAKASAIARIASAPPPPSDALPQPDDR